MQKNRTIRDRAAGTYCTYPFYDYKWFYDYYIKELDEIEKKHGYVVNYKTWKNIINDICFLAICRTISSGDIFALPVIGIGFRAVQRPSICWVWNKKKKEWVFYGMPDWKKTKELWASDENAKKEKKLIYYIPDKHSKVYSIIIRYLKINGIMGRFYKFRLSNLWKKQLKQYISENPKVEYTQYMPDFLSRTKRRKPLIRLGANKGKHAKWKVHID